MNTELVFGWRTAILIGPMVIMLLTACALLVSLRNRMANWILAALLVTLAGIITPWAIGFAGFYDRWPWLSFAPFANALFVAPLLYGYLHALVTGNSPKRFALHLLPGIAEFLFQAISFLLPLDVKWEWASMTHTVYDAIKAIGIVVGFTLYTLASFRLLRAYRTWLAGQRSDDNRFAVKWVERAIIAGLAMLLLWSAFEVQNQVNSLSYAGYMGLYIGISMFGVFLSVEGWRHAGMPFPQFDESNDKAELPSGSKDWAAMGQEWQNRLRSEELYRDPELSLTRLAREFGTNQTYLSRAFNEGLGLSFSALTNRLRSQAVAAKLETDPSADVLGVALDAGFNSKASFNRCFKAEYGMTPSAYRRARSQKA